MPDIWRARAKGGVSDPPPPSSALRSAPGRFQALATDGAGSAGPPRAPAVSFQPQPVVKPVYLASAPASQRATSQRRGFAVTAHTRVATDATGVLLGANGGRVRRLVHSNLRSIELAHD